MTMEKIIAAAVKKGDLLMLGNTHMEILEAALEQKFLLFPDQVTQGFFTDRARFVDRMEAAAVARKSGQIRDFTEELQSHHVNIHIDLGG